MAYEDWPEDKQEMPYSDWSTHQKEDFAEGLLKDPRRFASFIDLWVEWGLRVRRDILAYELFLRLRHGPQWGRYLQQLRDMPGEWDLSPTMSADRSSEMIRALLHAISETDEPGRHWPHGKVGEPPDAGDPGDPPMPPYE